MQVSYNDRDPVLTPPIVPYGRSDSPLGSRRSSQTSLNKDRPSSLSVNYVPAKFTKLHQPGGNWARNQKKQGGGRDAFATDASRMGQVGTVDDDEGTVFALGKGGLKQKKNPKLRWNRFKWVLMLANTLVSAKGEAKHQRGGALFTRVSADPVVDFIWNGSFGRIHPSLAECLFPLGRHPCGEQDRTYLYVTLFPFDSCSGLKNSVNDGIGHDGFHRPTWVFRDHVKQPTFPRRLHLLVVGLPRIDGRPWIYRLQAEDIQLGG